MIELVEEPRPEGKDTGYRFLRNEATGRRFKTRAQVGENIQGDPVATFTISCIGPDDRTIERRDDGAPLIHHHTHVFTDAERTAPDFNIGGRINEILTAAIEAKERDSAARAALGALTADWSGDEPLQLTPPPSGAGGA